MTIAARDRATRYRVARQASLIAKPLMTSFIEENEKTPQDWAYGFNYDRLSETIDRLSKTCDRLRKAIAEAVADEFIRRLEKAERWRDLEVIARWLSATEGYPAFFIAKLFNSRGCRTGRGASITTRHVRKMLPPGAF